MSPTIPHFSRSSPDKRLQSQPQSHIIQFKMATPGTPLAVKERFGFYGTIGSTGTDFRFQLHSGYRLNTRHGSATFVSAGTALRHAVLPLADPSGVGRSVIV
jgi:hypothetical protein